MLRALKNIDKMDRNYKDYQVRKRVIALALAVCFSASAYSCYYGVTQMRSERENLYLLDLAQAEQAEKTADYGTAQTLLQGAIQRQPGCLSTDGCVNVPHRRLSGRCQSAGKRSFFRKSEGK